MATLYTIADWNRHYENNRSRLVRELSWVPVPNNHDGEGYARIITHKNGAKIFAAWILILQVASRCEPRGQLIKSTGEPHDCESLALKTRAPAAWFADALPVLQQVGWLEHKQMADNELALGWQAGDAGVTPGCVSTVNEGNGREGKEQKRTEGREISPVSPSGLAEAIYEAYPRKTAKQDALRAIAKALKIVPHDRLLERTNAYATATMLWSEVDRQFIPHPATWFNRGSYDDDPQTWARQSKADDRGKAGWA